MLTSQFVAAFIILNVNHSIWLLYFVNAFQSSILYNLIPYATSDFESHSLINVIYVVAASMSAATYIPLSKILDVFGRAEGFLLMLVFAVFAGAVETVYSIANAHANDRTDPKDFVPLASTMLVAWSTAATIVPLAVTLLTPVFGPQTFIYAAMAVAIAYAIFVLLRLRERPRTPEEERETFELKSAQLPNAGAMAEPQTELPPPKD